MVAIPFIYFLGLFAYFFYRQRQWGMDLAATSLLIVISLSAIVIDVKDLYGQYGINERSITLFSLLLFCFQWTMVLIPLHLVSSLNIEKHHPIKNTLLYIFLIAISLSSLFIIMTRAGDIREALIMDLADVRTEHYKDLADSGDLGSNYLMLIPMILTNNPFPTVAIFFWFYMNSFMKTNIFLRTGVLIASVVQAIIAIIMAGRAAMIYWAFDFYLLFSFFLHYLPKRTKRSIVLTAAVIGGLASFLFISITVARFDSSGRNPFDSLYGYAGQHVNNFCTVIEHGGDSPTTIDRIFPLMGKLTGNSYDMMEHYENIVRNVKSSILVNVFDTFGGEIYLDLGWIGYILFFIFIGLLTLHIYSRWQEIDTSRLFLVIIMIAFFVRGLFAWPFTYHYTTFALILVLLLSYLFKYKFKI